MKKLVHPCPCGTNEEYDVCCKPYHQGALPKNALSLMRSRYSAYVLNIPEYIVATTHPASSQYGQDKFFWKKAIAQFSRASSFHRLEVLDVKENEKIATVTYTVYMSQKKQDASFTERGYFERIEGRWFYRGGDLAQGHAPNLVTTGQLRLLPLAYYGEAVLRQKAKPLLEITQDLRILIEEMVETMDACNGIGLAAPQVHHSIRLFVIRKPIETVSGDLELGEVKVFINPEIIGSGQETWKTSEGCLSIPTLQGTVERPRKIMMRYMTPDGSTLTEEFEGWEARAIQHEYDHIEGVLFIDHLDPKEQSKLVPFLRNLEERIRDTKKL